MTYLEQLLYAHSITQEPIMNTNVLGLPLPLIEVEELEVEHIELSTTDCVDKGCPHYGTPHSHVDPENWNGL